MKFLKYNCDYEGREKQFEEGNFKDYKNFWNEALDFNWHKQDKSPNWDAIDEVREVKRID